MVQHPAHDVERMIRLLLGASDKENLLTDLFGEKFSERATGGES